MRILIVSNMNARHPYGAWTRPFYLGKALAQTQHVFQVGFDCSDVTYGPSISVRAKSIAAYMRAIRQANADFKAQVVYAHETFPGVSAYLWARRHRGYENSHLVFDFHAASAHEYRTMRGYYENPVRPLLLFLKSFWPQRFIATSGRPIIAASEELRTLVAEWYRIPQSRIHVVPNGAPLAFLQEPKSSTSPYPDGVTTALMIAPNNMIANVLSVRFILQVAKVLAHAPASKYIQIAIAGGGWERDQLEQHPNVVYLGFVDDLLPYIDHADVCLLPFPRDAVCGGARNKALDYSARGKLVLSTPEGLRGLPECRHNEHVFVSSDDPGQFARDLSAVTSDLAGYALLGENARLLVKTKYNWESSASKVLSIFTQAFAREIIAYGN